MPSFSILKKILKNKEQMVGNNLVVETILYITFHHHKVENCKLSHSKSETVNTKIS